MAAERSGEPRRRRRVRGNRRWGLLGGKERCEAKVRQMVADNEGVETQGGGEAGWTPAGLSTETRSVLQGQRCEEEGRSGTDTASPVAVRNL